MTAGVPAVTDPAAPVTVPATAPVPAPVPVPVPVPVPAPLPEADASPTHCLNCGYTFGPSALRFCPSCGQETRIRPPTLMEFIQQFGGAYFSTEGALWRTLKLLILRPGELTRRYLYGQRKHFVLPLRLYLTISVIVLLLIRLTVNSSLDGPFKTDIDITAESGSGAASFTLDFGGGRAGMKKGVFYCEQFPDWVCKRLQRRIDTDPRGLQREMRQLGERVIGQIGTAMFVMLPAFAMWLKLVYVDRRLHYTEHLVFALHLHAFWFLALAAMMPGFGLMTFLSMVSVPVYALWALRRVYGGRFWTRLLRAGLISVLYLFTLAAVMLGLTLWALLA
jgi:hypothetical protein